MMDIPKISIVVPIYNVEQYIEECLNSVINQTFKDIEIICVDDCGNDNSIDIAEKIAKKDSRIKIIKHEKNKGQGPARNTGLDYIQGKYVTFLDSDDYFASDNILELLYEKIEETKVDFVMTDYDNWFDEYSEKAFSSDFINKVTLKNFNKVINNFPVVPLGKLFNSEYIKKNNLKFIESKDIHEDVGFSLKLLSTYPKYTSIPYLGVFYRKNPSSIMSTKNKEKSSKGNINNLKDAIEYVNNNCKDTKKIIYKIKNSYKFKRFYTPIGKIFRFCWEKYDKHIVFFCINFYSEKIQDNKIITKILGIKTSEKVLHKGINIDFLQTT